VRRAHVDETALSLAVPEEIRMNTAVERREFLRAVGLGAATMALPQLAWAAAGARRKPNIIVIISDDAGYADFSVHGSKQFLTPRIDSIARNGVRFTDGYVSAPVCSPTRAGLLTGRYQQRFGHELNIPPVYSEENGLPVGETTLAKALKRLGYRTIAVGKWHLGYAPKFHPCSRGFDDYFGFLQGSRPYWPKAKPTRLNRLLRDREPIAEAFEYLTDELGEQAAAYIDQYHDRPFFIYLAPNAVHAPMHAKPGVLAKIKGIEKKKRRKLAAMTVSLDEAVGRVLDCLKKHRIERDTLLFFINDNGGATNNASVNTPLRGHKGQTFEGGIRVPFLVQWPGVLPAGKVYGHPVSALDIFPTALHAADRKPSGEERLDGVDLLPYLRGAKTGRPHETLYWRFGEKWAIRVGDWKLLRQGDDLPMLFHLADDIGEKNDLAAEHPEHVAALEKKYKAWASELAKPRWRKQGRKKAATDTQNSADPD
jgi:arylsulfatase A-like enzyme